MNGFERRGNHMAKDILQQKIFIIVNGDSLESEEDIFVTRANCKDEALIQYADEYYAKNKYFKESIEDRAINMTFWEPFFSNIYYYENGEILTDLNDDEIEIKLKENIEEYLGEYKKFTLN